MDKILEQIMEIDALLNAPKKIQECVEISESPFDNVLEQKTSEEIEEGCTAFDKYMDDLTIKEAKNALRFQGAESPLREVVKRSHNGPLSRTVWSSK
jgi:predicted house-cleaning noncanonical NTP pyrophosphatase (MazG superfamily)